MPSQRWNQDNFLGPKPGTRTKGFAGMFDVAVENAGVKNFEKRLEALTPSLKREVNRKVVRAAGSGFRSIMKKHAPLSHRTGTAKRWSKTLKATRQKDALVRSISVKPSSGWNNPSKYARIGVIGVTVGHADRGNKIIGPHAHLVNKGHKLTAWGQELPIKTSATDYLNIYWDEAVGFARNKMIAKSKQALEVAIRKAASK